MRKCYQGIDGTVRLTSGSRTCRGGKSGDKIYMCS